MATVDSLVPEGAKNVGGYDRAARAVGCALFAALGVALVAWGQFLVGTLAVVAAVGLFFNVVTQFCGVNAVLGIDTCSRADGDCE